MRRLARHLWLWLPMAAGLGACSILPSAEPQDFYRLPPSSVAASQAAVVDRALRIDRPSANTLLRSTRIVVIPEGNRLSVYEGARWSSPAPSLWRDHMLDAFRNDGRVARLSRADERFQGDVELGGSLRAFQVEYREGGPEVVIQFDAHLVDIASRRIVASRRFAITERVDGEKVPAVVAAFGRACDALAGELIDWTMQHLE